MQNLEEIYKQFRYYSYEEFLDAQTLLHLVVINFKEGRMPETWRYQDFSIFIQLKDRFKTLPLGYEESPLYSNKEERKQGHREFVQWKKLFTYFILLTSYVESSAQVEEYFDTSLMPHANEKGEISLEEFIKVKINS